MSKHHSANRPTPVPKLLNGGIMAEAFAAIGFEVLEEDSYNLLAEYTEANGEPSRIYRGETALHGRCWKIGQGLEVWATLFEENGKWDYADCRPAFRSRYVQTLPTWELTEFEDNGEAVVRGTVQQGTDVVFELQNLTELPPLVLREMKLQVALAGLAYQVWAQPHSPTRRAAPRFDLAERFPEFAQDAYESDYLISGRVLAWREIINPVTAGNLAWVYLDINGFPLEILVSRQALKGRLTRGATVTAHVWLQGHILTESEMAARYEGVDREYNTSDFWAALRHDN